MREYDTKENLQKNINNRNKKRERLSSEKKYNQIENFQIQYYTNIVRSQSHIINIDQSYWQDKIT